MKLVWFEEAWADYSYWFSQDKRTIKKINELIKDIERNKYTELGKPEPLKGELGGFWSRRIDETNRLVYRVTDNMIEVLSCKGHYDDK